MAREADHARAVLSNPNTDRPATITMTRLSRLGNPIDTLSLQIPPMQQVVKFITEFKAFEFADHQGPTSFSFLKKERGSPLEPNYDACARTPEVQVLGS